MQFDHTEQVKALAAMPPEPLKPRDRGFWGSTWDATKGGGRGVLAGTAQVLGSTADVAKGLSIAAPATRGDARAPVGMEMPGDDMEPQRGGVPADEVFRSSDVGRSFRSVADGLRPNPATAGLAEQVVFDFARVLTKLIPATLAGGGAGLALASAEEGFTQSDALAEKGVDLVTRTKVGGLTTAVTAVSAGLPLVGPTLKATTALYLAGGPGGFMAQQALTRSILERADYAELAATYDPLDLTGLALSALIPLPFAGYGALRNIRAAKAAAPKPAGAPAAGDPAPAVPTVATEPIAPPAGVSRDAVDAALAHNLTLHADAVGRAESQRIPGVTPAERAANLKAWFGESQVVDEKGQPAVVYHATGQQFDSFKTEGNYSSGERLDAALFSDKPDYSNEYAQVVGGRGQPVQTIPVYLALRNPLEVEMSSRDFSDPRAEAAVIAQARAAGHDGVIFKDESTGDKFYAAFDPKQVKSAIGNSGRFDPTSASLTDPPAPVGQAGAAAEVVTERGLTAPVRYRLVEAGDLITSHTDDLTPNAAFPAEMQPRDRTRAASADQIARIENAIRPELLGESVKASDGAPIIGPDAVVESGNARTIALRRAYGSGKADGYRAWLSENAERFGLTREDVAGMQRPVLVRERLGETDRAEFARQANESAVASFSVAEQARADAARITDLSDMFPNDDGTISMAKSGPFVRAFMASVSPTERGTLMQADGRLSQAGQQRIRNAVFAKAYGDSDLVAMLAESTDSNVRNILSGLLRAAPEVARLQDLIAAGARQPMDFAPDLVRAVRELDALREQGRSLSNVLDQGDMLGAESPALHNLMVGLAENARSPRRVAELVRRMVDAVDALGDPRQALMLDDAAVKPENVAADAVERMRNVSDEQLTGTETALAAPKVDALMRSVTDRVQAIELQSPEMRVTDDLNAAEFMAQARRGAAEGTDLELGALDADLLRVAADCALSSPAGV